MAAIDLTQTNEYPHTVRTQLSGTPNTQQEYILPAACTQVQIIAEVNSMRVITQGGTDAAVISTEAFLEVPAGSLYFHDIARARGAHSIWIASGTASTVISLQVGARD